MHTLSHRQIERIESRFDFITEVAYHLLGSLKTSPIVTFDFSELLIRYCWDEDAHGSEGGIIKGKPVITYSAFDATFNCKANSSTSLFIYTETAEEVGIDNKFVSGSCIVPVCCLVAHELAHVVIFHHEATHKQPFSLSHGDEWQALYLELRIVLLCLFEKLSLSVEASQAMTANLPEELALQITDNLDRTHSCGGTYKINEAVDLFIEQSFESRNRGNFIAMARALTLEPYLIDH